MMRWQRIGCVAMLWLVAAGPRVTTPVNDGWRFIREDAAGADAPAFDDAAWQPVDLPHTWNKLDGEDGGNDYYRGPAWYRRHLRADPAWAGRRVYLRVGAANTTAAVYVNGKPAGTHKGGFAAFCYDVTPLLNMSGDNVVAVRVDNAKDADVPPLSADFTFFGGLYRGVTLIVADPVGILPLQAGSSGVFVQQDSVTADEAKLTVTTLVRNAGTTDQTAAIHADVAGVTADATRVLKAGESAVVQQHLVVPKPHLWNGRKDPFLYTAKVSLGSDVVEQPVGLRFYRFDPEKGFFLNGQPYRLYGVNRHQDRIDRGWAVSADDERSDAANIVDLGCTGVRLAHYQQSASFYDLMDRAGIVVWAEVPVVNDVTVSPAFADNAEQQLRELVQQNFNHPSICVWGMFNELSGRAKEPGQLALVQRLNAAAHELDPTRPTTSASNRPVEDQLAMVTDVAAYNRYPGWYGGKMDQWPATLDQIHAAHPERAFAISEYGAGASVAQHEAEPVKQPKPVSPWHPEEYQADLHEHAWAAMRDRPWLWGTFVWCLHDFAADQRKEGDHLGRNDKGLVTYDGKTRKDAFYFYQANWAEKSMVHVTGRRFTPRPAGGGVKVYSNCDQVKVTVNGQALPAVKPNDVRVFVWADATLKAGENKIEAVGMRGGATVTDGYTVVVDPNTK